MASNLQFLDGLYLAVRYMIITVICQTLLYGYSYNVSYVTRADYRPSTYPRHIFVSRSNRGSHHGVRNSSPNPPNVFFLKGFSYGTAPMDSKVNNGSGSSPLPLSYLCCRQCIGSFLSPSCFYSSIRGITLSGRAMAVTTLPLALSVYLRRPGWRYSTPFSLSMSVQYSTGYRTRTLTPSASIARELRRLLEF
jgi:hypothetical protein